MPLFGMSGAPDASLLETMQQALSHRGTTTKTGSVGGEFVQQHGNVTVAWSGRLYSGNNETLAADFATNGTSILGRLNGEFIIAARQGDSLCLARDPAGARTAYFGRIGNRWFVAAEPKGIWKLPGFDKRIRAGALAQYFSFSFVPGSHTMLEDLWEVCPGHYVRLRDGREPESTRYFNVPLEPMRDAGAIVDSPGKFRKLLQEEVAKRLRSNVQPTVFLSGGLDSSVVTAEVVRQSSQRVRTFAIHFGRQYPNELEFARSVADRLGTDHEEVEIRPRDAVRRIREMVWHLDEPIGDPITSPNFELAAHAASRGVVDVFNGEGGDPLFGGPKNLPMLMGHWYGGVDHSEGFRERRYIESYRRGFEELPHVLTPSLLETCEFDRDLYSPLKPFFQSDGPFLHKLLAINTQLKGAHLILPKVERMLAASGLTPLSPLFTKDMIRMTFNAPPRAKLQRGIEKWLMKEAYRDLLPDAVIDRPKSGMRVPVHFWFKGPLKRFARSLLSKRELQKAGIFKPERVKQWLAYDIEKPNGRYGLRLWMVLTFEIWRRIVIEGEPV